VVAVLDALIRLYQRVAAGRMSPCRYVPSCSTYAREALAHHGAARGSWPEDLAAGVRELGGPGAAEHRGHRGREQAELHQREPGPEADRRRAGPFCGGELSDAAPEDPGEHEQDEAADRDDERHRSVPLRPSARRRAARWSAGSASANALRARAWSSAAPSTSCMRWAIRRSRLTTGTYA